MQPEALQLRQQVPLARPTVGKRAVNLAGSRQSRLCSDPVTTASRGRGGGVLAKFEGFAELACLSRPPVRLRGGEAAAMRWVE